MWFSGKLHNLEQNGANKHFRDFKDLKVLFNEKFMFISVNFEKVDFEKKFSGLLKNVWLDGAVEKC